MKYHESEEWKRYMQLVSERPEAFSQGKLEIITDEEAVDHFFQQTGRKLGVVYESPYHMMVVDLVKNTSGEDCGNQGPRDKQPFAYERLLPAVASGAVVAVPVCQGKLVVLRQFRHAVRRSVLAFPRGFGESGISEEENLVKEIFEELGTEEVENLRKLGILEGDNGILATRASVYFCEIQEYEKKKGYEGIEDILLFSPGEFEELIGKGEVWDGYTLAAYALFKAAFPDW